MLVRPGRYCPLRHRTTVCSEQRQPITPYEYSYDNNMASNICILSRGEQFLPVPWCWYPHPPATAMESDLALQCEIGASGRVVERCREIFGEGAVVGTSRAALTRDTDVMILVRPEGARGPAAAARALACDPHLLAVTKRIYATSAAAAGGGAAANVSVDTPEALAEALAAGASTRPLLSST